MKETLYRLFEHQYLGKEEARQILQGIAQGCYNDAQIASLITVFLMRNISVEELAGFREALLDMRVPVDLQEFKPIDIVGTGGDGKNTFNISTTSCFVVAGAGYHVVKHGNYGATSVSGASNVMEQHGVKFTADVDKLRHSMEQCRIAYLHAPLFNPALKAVAPVRKMLGVRSFFNMLGRWSIRLSRLINSLASITCHCSAFIIIHIRRAGRNLPLSIVWMVMMKFP